MEKSERRRSDFMSTLKVTTTSIFWGQIGFALFFVATLLSELPTDSKAVAAGVICMIISFVNLEEKRDSHD